MTLTPGKGTHYCCCSLPSFLRSFDSAFDSNSSNSRSSSTRTKQEKERSARRDSKTRWRQFGDRPRSAKHFRPRYCKSVLHSFLLFFDSFFSPSFYLARPSPSLCDQIWRNLATLANVKRYLANVWQFIFYLEKCWAYFGKFVTFLGLFFAGNGQILTNNSTIRSHWRQRTFPTSLISFRNFNVES